MKKCNACNTEKPESEFYKGHAKCKSCYILKVKAHREEKADYYREYDNNRANLPHRVEARKAYSKTDQGKEHSKVAKQKWQKENVIKRAANLIIGNAVRDGKIIKPLNCEVCNCKPSRLHGHHDDYNYPMTVRWLCSKCHTAWHKEHGSGING